MRRKTVKWTIYIFLVLIVAALYVVYHFFWTVKIPSDWETYTSGIAGFSVKTPPGLMPRQFKISTVHGDINFMLRSTDYINVTYEILYAELSTDIRDNFTQAQLFELQISFLTQKDYTLIKKDNADWKTWPSLYSKWKSSDGKSIVINRDILVNNMLYRLVVLMPKKTAPAKMPYVRAFFNSFKFTNRKKL